MATDPSDRQARKTSTKLAQLLPITRAVGHREGKRILGFTKTGETRNVTIPSHIRECVKDHLAQFVSSDPDALLFTAAMGGCHLNDRVFKRCVQESCERYWPFPVPAEGMYSNGYSNLPHWRLCIFSRPPVSMK